MVSRCTTAGGGCAYVSKSPASFQSYHLGLAQLRDGVEGARGLAGSYPGHRGSLHGDPLWCQVAKDKQVRRAIIVLFTIAFLTAAIAGLFGAFSNKAAPVH
jgi:hypothetical protein